MDIRWTSLLAVSLCIAALPLAPAKAVTLQLPYEGAAPLAYPGAQECEDAVALGVVCVDLPRGARAAAFRVLDASSLAVGGTYWLHDADGNALGGGRAYCSGAEVALPAEAQLLVVRIEAVNGALTCIDGGSDAAAVGTKGVVSVDLR